VPKPVHKPEKEAPKNAYLCAFSDGESECESWDDDDDFGVPDEDGYYDEEQDEQEESEDTDANTIQPDYVFNIKGEIVDIVMPKNVPLPISEEFEEQIMEPKRRKTDALPTSFNPKPQESDIEGAREEQTRSQLSPYKSILNLDSPNTEHEENL
jgi:hypothetical protein